MFQKIISLIVLLIWMVPIKSQDLALLGSGGGMTSTGNLFMSYSFGEPCIQESLNGNQWITEGFQQPESIHLMVGTHETTLNENIRVFPNPTSSTITISGMETNQRFEVSVLNLLGQTLLTQLFNANDEHILGIENLSPGLYLLNLRSKSSSLFTQSIVKL